MALKAKDLRQKAGKCAARQSEILDAATDMLTKEQEAEFDKLHDEEQDLLRQAVKLEAAEKREIEDDPDPTVIQPNSKKAQDLKGEERKKAEELAMRSFLATGAVPQELRALMPSAKGEKDDNEFIKKELDALGIRAAQQSTADASGGYTIPEGFMVELQKALLAFGGMWSIDPAAPKIGGQPASICRVWRTSQGNDVLWPNVDDTAEANEAYLLAEAGNAETAAQKVTFGAPTTFGAFKYTSGLIRISSEIIQDSAFDIASEIVDMLATRIWRGTNRVLTGGDGAAKPNGVVTASSYFDTKVFGLTDGTAYNALVDFFHSIDPAYRGNARWMFHDSSLREMKKIKDANNVPLWNPIAGIEPNTILGKSYTINQHMADFDTGGKIMLFGDFRKYVIRLVRNMRIVRLNERFGDTDEIGYVVFFRLDGDLLNTGTPIKHMRIATT